MKALACFLAIANLAIGFAIDGVLQICIGVVFLAALTLGRVAAARRKQWRPHAHYRPRVR